MPQSHQLIEKPVSLNYGELLIRATKIVAYPGFGEDILRLRGVRFDLLAQVGDVDAHIVYVANIFPAPDIFQ